MTEILQQALIATSLLCAMALIVTMTATVMVICHKLAKADYNDIMRKV